MPASAFESPRRPLTAGDLQGLLRRRRVIGLAEMMNFPGVIAGDPAELEKLALEGAAHADGHAPGVLGKALNAYAASGIRSDHEALTVEEGRQRLRAGMWLLIREASMARNLEDLLPLVQEFGPARMAFCTDDRDPEDIADSGHLNQMVRKAVAAGVAPEDALVLASLNPATWHGLDHLGAIAPGYQADLVVLDDLESFEPRTVLKAGRAVADIPEAHVPEWVKRTVHVQPISAGDFSIPWDGGRARVIGLVEDQVVTDELIEEPTVVDDQAVSDPDRDLAKIAVIERHHGTGRIGLGFVRGFGLRSERSPRRSPTMLTTSSSSASTTTTWPGRCSGSSSSAAASSPSSRAACGPSCRYLWPACSPMRRWPRSSLRAARATRRRPRSAARSRRRFSRCLFLALSVIPKLKITDPASRRRPLRDRPAQLGRLSRRRTNTPVAIASAAIPP